MSGTGASDARARQNAARDWMKAQGLDAVLAFNDGQNSFLNANAVYVFTGFRGLGESAALILRDGSSALLTVPEWDRERAESQAQADLVFARGDLPAALDQAVARFSLRGARIAGVHLSRQSRRLAAAVAERFNTPIAPADSLAADLARVRSRDELARMRKAVWIAEQGYRSLLEKARPGLREFELAAEIYAEMKALGAEDNFLLMSASQHNLAVRAAGRRVLEAGDVLLAEITPCYAGQFAQICRTVVLGETPAPMPDAYALLQQAMRRGLEAATPGALVKDATEAMNAVFRKAGYGDYCRPPFMRVRGHGLGITSDRPGDLTDASETRFEEGMIFVMHPNQYIPETGYLMCGETVVVSHNGAVSMSDSDANLDRLAV